MKKKKKYIFKNKRKWKLEKREKENNLEGNWERSQNIFKGNGC